MVRMERHQAAASTASTAYLAQLQTLLTQGKFHSYQIFEMLKFARSFIFFSIEPRVLTLPLHLWKVLGRPPVRRQPAPYGLGLGHRLG
jgi:hypothetical protein